MDPLAGEPNAFGEVLRVLGRKELVNLVRRLKAAGVARTAEIVSDEIDERDEFGHPDYPQNVNLP